MADSTPTGVAGAPQVPNPAPSPGTPIAPESPKYVTLEQFSEFTRRLDGISAGLRKLEPLATVVAPPAPPKEPDTLTTRVKAIEDRENAIKERERVTQVRDALKANGVPEKRAEREARLLLMERGETIKTADDYSVHMHEGETKTPVADWIAAYIKTDAGRELLPPEPAPAVPTGKGLTGGRGAAATTAGIEKMSYSELMANPMAAAQLRAEKPEVWAAKREEHYAKPRGK